MNKNIVVLTLCLLFLKVNAQEFNKDEIITTSKRIAQQLIAQEYDSIVLSYDTSLSKELSASRLEGTVLNITPFYGEIESADQPVLENQSYNIITRTKLKFAKAEMVLSLTFTEDGLVKGMFISPYSNFYNIPSYVKDLSFLEGKYEFGKEGWKIKGTISYPRDDQKHPLVIIVHGSGPTDRDGSIGRTKIYRDLAWGLASKGICVFRYDKRSYIHGSKLFMEAYQGKDYTPYDEVVEDVLYAIELMKKNVHVDTNNIIILGHSQGGMMAPLIAKNADVKAMIFLAANAHPMQDLLIEQMNYLYPDSIIGEKEYVEKVKVIRQANFAKKKKLPLETPTDSLPFNVRAGYWNYLNEYNQVKVFQKTKQPALILQGERDYQVTMTDFKLWQKAAKKRKAPTVFISYPSLNHLFIAGEGLSKPSEYNTSGSLNEKVVTDISTWIKDLK
jgi:dienelactone hydrolase